MSESALNMYEYGFVALLLSLIAICLVILAGNLMSEYIKNRPDHDDE